MALPVVYRRKVGRDLAGTYGRYEDQRSGLGEEFLAAVDATFDAIERIPEMFRRVHGEVRRANVSRTLFSTASIPGALSYSRYFTRHVIQNSGRSQKAEPANRRIETDRCTAGHAGR